MKRINTLLIGSVFLSLLASCEMKEELSGDKTESGEMGLLDLTVTAGSSSTVMTKADVDTKDVNLFPVYIINAAGDTTKKFSSFDVLKEQNPIELPVGTYTVNACSPGEYGHTMTSPFYAGEKEVEISSVTTTTEVSCTIQNVKISFVPSAAFRNTYSSWTVTVTDRATTDPHTKIFTEASPDAEYEYWKMADNIDKIYIDGTAVTKTGGETVSIHGVAEKSKLQGHESSDGNFFKGGDELVIGLEPDKVEGTVAGVEKDVINITISGFNAETNQTITIEVTEDGGESGSDSDTPSTTPDDPSSPITISDNGTGYLTNGVSKVDDQWPTDLAINITVPNKIESLYVRVESTNDDFKSQIGGGDSTIKDLVGSNGMDLTSGVTDLSTLFELPEKGSDSYVFTMSSQLFMMLGMFEGTHTFHLTVNDQAGNSKSATLVINN